jgi:hypothetical protein
MTREEQINLYLKERNIPITSLEANSIIEGIKWADKHPNLYNDEKYHTVKVSCLDELNRKAKLYDTFLEKACEWLNNINTDNYMDSGVFQMYNLVLDFKQAMEE